MKGMQMLLAMAYLYENVMGADECTNNRRRRGHNKPCRRSKRDTDGAFGKGRKYMINRKFYRRQLREERD